MWCTNLQTFLIFPLMNNDASLPICISKSNEKAMNRNYSNQMANPTLKTKMGNNQNYKLVLRIQPHPAVTDVVQAFS